MDSNNIEKSPVPVITGGEVLELAECAKVRPILSVSRETLAYRLIVGYIALAAAFALVTIVAFTVLTVRDPKSAKDNLELCLRLYKEIVPSTGLPLVLPLAVGFLFGRQGQGSPPDKT